MRFTRLTILAVGGGRSPEMSCRISRLILKPSRTKVHLDVVAMVVGADDVEDLNRWKMVIGLTCNHLEASVRCESERCWLRYPMGLPAKSSLN